MFVPPQLPLSQLLTHADQLQRSGNLVGAAGVFRQVLRQQPRNVQALSRLGQVLIGIGELDEAKRTLEQAIKIAPKEPVLHHDMHLLHRRRTDHVRAHESLDKALRLSPRHPVFTASKAELLMSAGDFDRAMKTLEPVLSMAGQSGPVALVLASLSPRFNREAQAIEALRAVTANAEIAIIVRMRAGFALAHLLDWTGDYNGAAAAASKANALQNSEWDHEAHSQKVDRCIEAWTKDAVAALPMGTADASDLVLVVGMPRCGNLLVARMLAALDDTVSVGERNDVLAAAREMEGMSDRGAPILLNFMGMTESAMTQRAQAYLGQLRGAHPKAKRLVDRNSLNMLGLGVASRMLPNVRVIHCRRDPADSAVACWFAPFTAVSPFMYDQKCLGAFQRDADRLMNHWTSVLDMPIHEIRYEDLLERPEAIAREIATFVGADWNERALEPARMWVGTMTQPDGSMRNLIPDGRPGIAKDYESRLPELFASLRA